MKLVLRKSFASLLSAFFAVAMVAVSFDTAEARGRGGGHARMHSHHGHHSRPHHRPHKPNRPHHRPDRPHHRPDHKPGHGNHHHHHGHDHWHHHYDHYGRWAAGVATGLAIGTVAYGLPRGCRTVYVSNVKYWDCGGVWYRARYRGSDVVYVVVDRP